jgi:hypothetical protein
MFPRYQKISKYKQKHRQNVFMVDCSKFYQQNIPSFYPFVNTDRTIFSVYTEKITVEKERIKKNQKV